MRIKFKKGFTVERIADAFVEYVRDNDIVIGSVNIYIQTFDKEMRVEKISRNKYIEISPTDIAEEEYKNEIVDMRRSRIKLLKAQ